jgi:secreted trypsin-like serine protease
MKNVAVAVLGSLLASMSVAVPERSAYAWASESAASQIVESASPIKLSPISPDFKGPGPSASVNGLDETSRVVAMTGPGKRAEEPDDSDRQIQARIVGGSNYSITQAPWQVALIDAHAGNNFAGQFCGGSIYSQYWIITAAHCVTDASASNIRILAGRATLGTDLSPLAVSQILIHPAYNDDTLANDIALIRLATPLTFSSSVAAIELATSIPKAGSPAVITGWGDTWIQSGTGFVWNYYGSPRFPDHLQGATVAIQSNSFCAGEWGSDFNSTMMVCSAVPGYWKDVCFGDSGGPLAVNSGGRWALAGVTSFGSGCAWSSAGVYANVANYRSWIIANAAGFPFDVSPVPTISGSAVVGQTLTASLGEWSPEPTTTAYQWLLNGKAISRATGSTYVVGSKDVGRQVSVRVTGSKASYLSTARESTWTSAVLAGFPFDVSPVPTISGSAVVGQTLTASLGEWSPEPTTTAYQWLLNGKAISRATGSTYVVGSKDVGRQVSVRVTGSRASYVSTVRESTRTSAVVSAP